MKRLSASRSETDQKERSLPLPCTGFAPFTPPLPLAFVLGLLAVLVYLPSYRNEFVNYDDPDYLTSNYHVQQGITWASVKWAFTTGHASNWHPLTWLSHSLDWQVFGDRAGGHHLISAVIHGANTLLVLLFFWHVTGACWRSAMVAALFAFHPLHVESVAWASERKDVLSTLFGLLCLIAYAAYAGRPIVGVSEKSEPGPIRGKGVWYSLTFVFLALGLLSKPMLVTWPFLMLLLDYWPLGRFPAFKLSSGQGPPERAAKPTETLAGLLVEKLPFLLLCVASSVITYLVQRKGGAVSFSLTIYERIANALVSYCRYLEKGFWPSNLSVLYPHPGKWPLWLVIGAICLLAPVTGAVILFRRQRPYLFVGWLLFAGTLVPTIGLVQVGVQSMADRYTYFPFLGIFLIFVWGLAELLEGGRIPFPVRNAGAVVMLVSLIGLTERQLAFWHDSERLFRHAVAVTDKNYLAWNNLGFFLSNKGKFEEATDCYRKSIEINPRYEEALNNMGFALAGQKRVQEAIPWYLKALAIRPNHPEVHNNLGNALADIGQLDAAIEHYQAALKENPEHADAHNNYGIALAMKGRLEEAIPHFYAALKYKKNYASAHSNLGNALAIQGKLPEAIREYEACLKLNPDDSQGHNNLANAYVQLGRPEEARLHYQESLRLAPDNPEAHYNLALVLIREGHAATAREHLGEALRLKPGYPEAQKQLEMMSR